VRTCAHVCARVRVQVLETACGVLLFVHLHARVLVCACSCKHSHAKERNVHKMFYRSIAPSLSTPTASKRLLYLTSQTVVLATMTLWQVSVDSCGGDVDAPEFSVTWSDGVRTDDRSGLEPGTYSVLVAYSNTCAKRVSFVVPGPEPSPVVIEFLKIDVTCFGGSDAYVTAIPRGGAAPYSFTWDDDGSIDSEARCGLSAGE
jgi:hypothetical protein